ncbi:ethanolamine ammonia-lyase subunit EutC [Persicitalea jodogahamensis]|uniref:ethanolamine ammonia-lyase subunit EutC n=1 Tax=Persicitalea jodogahamensis TaxID=402147 RepID=UPI001672D22D
MEQSEENLPHLYRHTPARVALGRTGHSLPTQRLLEFNLDHARARDAVYSHFDWGNMESQLTVLGLPSVRLQSQAADRREYLLRPDYGRTLSQDSRREIQNLEQPENHLCIVIADGLSAVAVNTHAGEVVRLLLEKIRAVNWRLAPVSLVEQGRVAIADEIGEVLRSEISLILIGERPGLTSPHSLGAYLTHRPCSGLTDERRNCVSNIRPDGLSYERAAEKIFYLLQEMKHHQLSGVGLKDRFSAKGNSING